MCGGHLALTPRPQSSAPSRWLICHGKLFLAPASSLLLISCPCDPGNALLPRAAAPRLETLFLHSQEPSCLEVGVARSCGQQPWGPRAGRAVRLQRAQLMTNLLCTFPRVRTAHRGYVCGRGKLYPGSTGDKRAHFGASLPEETVYLNSEPRIKFFQKRRLARSPSAWRRREMCRRLTSG